MDLNIVTIIYLFFRLAPFIIVSYFAISPITCSRTLFTSSGKTRGYRKFSTFFCLIIEECFAFTFTFTPRNVKAG